MDVPDVRFARSGGVAIAYQVVGDAPQLLVYVPPLTNLYALWQLPLAASFLRRLSEVVTLVLLNPRGTGLSDRPRNLTVESRMDDVHAVLEATGAGRATIFGADVSATACALFAATYPEHCERLALFVPFARSVRGDSYPYGESEDDLLAYIREARATWGDRSRLESFARSLFHAELTADPAFLEWFVWERRLAASPMDAADFGRMVMEIDVTSVLGAIRVPTLVMHRAARADEARYVAERIPRASVVQLAGDGRWMYSDDVADALIAFVRGEARPAVPDSVLASVLFTDLVGSTHRASELGDRRWRELLERHHADVRAELGRYRGVEVDTAGDGFFCRFDGPARAIACARRIVEGARELGLDVRAGIHTGECELVSGKIAGIAVVTGSRISSLAGPGDVLVSGTVKDLVAGSDLAFEDRGEHELKGVPGRWRLYAVVDG